MSGFIPPDRGAFLHIKLSREAPILKKHLLTTDSVLYIWLRPATPHSDRMTNAHNFLYTYDIFIWKLVRGISQKNLAFGFYCLLSTPVQYSTVVGGSQLAVSYSRITDERQDCSPRSFKIWYWISVCFSSSCYRFLSLPVMVPIIWHWGGENPLTQNSKPDTLFFIEIEY